MHDCFQSDTLGPEVMTDWSAIITAQRSTDSDAVGENQLPQSAGLTIKSGFKVI